MRFSIQEEGKEKQIFFTFKEASEKTGLSSKTIWRVLETEKPKYFRRTDKNVFWIQDEEESPFIQIDGEDFSSAEEIQERFGLSRTVFFNQLCKKKTHFLDSGEKSHEITWASPSLEKLLNLMRVKEANSKFLYARAKKGISKMVADSYAGMDTCIANYQATF